MKQSDIAAIVLSMKGMMPESSRYLLGTRFLKEIGLHLQKKDAKLLIEWQDSGGPNHFLALCEFNSGPPWVNHDMAIHNTDLSNFCNRWMNVERIRIDGGDWEPLTSEQNDIRCRMVDELKALAENEISDA